MDSKFVAPVGFQSLFARIHLFTLQDQRVFIITFLNCNGNLYNDLSQSVIKTSTCWKLVFVAKFVFMCIIAIPFTPCQIKEFVNLLVA